MAVNTTVKDRKANRKATTIVAVLLLMMALCMGLFFLPANRTEAASSMKTVTSCKDLVVKQYSKQNNIWWTYQGNTRVSYTGVAKNSYGWWRTVNGKVDFNYTGVAKNDYGWWRVENGKVNFSASGVYKNEFGWWYVNEGKVQFNYTGMKSNSYGSWRIEGGKVNFGFNGLAPDESGHWFYFKDGKVDYSKEGLVKNDYGVWYVRGGKIDFTYNGTYRGYTIQENKVVASPANGIQIEDRSSGAGAAAPAQSSSTSKTTAASTNQKNLNNNNIITDKNGNVVVEDKGIVVDISKWNGEIDFKQLKSSGVKGVMMRAAYSTSKDIRFDKNSAGCEANGIKYGVYQFATFHYNSTKDAAFTRAKQQADALLGYLKGKKIDGYVCLDLELESGQKLLMNADELTDVANYWCDYVQQAGYMPMIYCSVSWLQNNLVASRIHAPFWLAYYNDTGSYNFPKTGYGNYMNSIDGKITMWQYTDKGNGKAYGMESDYVDLNRLYHSFTGATK